MSIDPRLAGKTEPRRGARSVTVVGFCECGCGQETPIATRTDRVKGHVKGVPMRFVRFHKTFATHPLRGSDNNRFNGGLCFSAGRWMIVHRDGKAHTHYYRAVMEAHLGRELQSGEIVHHVNGDSSDDRIENLELTNRSEHMKMHRADLTDGRRAA
jgi:hypothetical protein